MSIWNKHRKVETNVSILFALSLFVVSIGGLVEIVPLFYINNTIEDVEGVRPYTPLELEGRNIYMREGCYVCHSQMIRALRDEVERYGHYSLAAESKYDHPFLWGSKRTGPDLAREGVSNPDAVWHVRHLKNPQSVMPQSIMPRYEHLAKTRLDYRYLDDLLRAHKRTGVPYSDEMVEQAQADLRAQLAPDADSSGLKERYGENVNINNFDGESEITEMDALVAYILVLGTMVDFSTFTPDWSR